MILKPNKIELKNFSDSKKFNETKFGLPSNIEFCVKCAISNQRPVSEKEFTHNINTKKKTVKFKNGICSGCEVVERKKKVIDWKEREKELIDLCNKYRSTDGKYDCLLPGSGGKDSFYASYILKYKYKMNPLTVTWAPHIYTDWGWHNFQAWIKSGFDNYLFTPNGKTQRLLTRLAIEKIFHPFQPFIMGQNLFPIRLAAKNFNIKLIFYGDTNAEFGNPDDFNNSLKPLEYFTKKDLKDIYIAGTSYDELVQKYKISRQDLSTYLPLTEKEFVNSGVKVHYLGYYLPWHPQNCYYFAVENGGFKPAPERNLGTYSKYSSIDDKMDDFHFYTTFIKFGIGRATHDASQEIRNGEINRDEAISLIKQFDGEYPLRFSEEIFQYLSIDQKTFGDISKEFEQSEFNQGYFDLLTDSFRSPHLWLFKDSRWQLRNPIYRNEL